MSYDECVFCGIAKGSQPAYEFLRTDSIIGIMDIYPLVPYHVLLLPTSHFADIYELPEDTVGEMAILAKRVAQALKLITKCEGVNIMMANGSAAGQTVFHAHMHVLPRFLGDGLFVPFGHRPRATQQQLEKHAKQIMEALDGV
jgi:histidine triad (HIT) family protein